MRFLYKALKKLSLLAALLLCAAVFAVLLFLYFFNDLPSTREISGCFTTEMYGVAVCPSKPSYTPLSQIPPHTQAAVIMSEDGAFHSHNGFDWFELRESLNKNITQGRIARGGSTITQQLAKNLYLSQEKTLTRKFKEVLLTLEIEKKLSKHKILELYFNVVEFAPNTYGIKAAAKHYFQKVPGQLTLAESLFLATLLPNPKKLSRSFGAKKLGPYHQNQMKVVGYRLLKTGKVSENDHSLAVQRIDAGFWNLAESSFLPTQSPTVEPTDKSIEDFLLEDDSSLEPGDSPVGEEDGQ